MELSYIAARAECYRYSIETEFLFIPYVEKYRSSSMGPFFSINKEAKVLRVKCIFKLESI